jgi:sugar O-acyltransferase (sialic acid O-acetyltransferase NeuD family)
MRDIAILGDAGFAREVFFLIDQINKLHNTWDVTAFFIQKFDGPRYIFGVPVLSEEEIPKYKNLYLVTGMGDPKIKKSVVNSIKEKYPYVKYASLVHPNVCIGSGEIFFHESVILRDGAIITAGNILTINIEVGSHVHLNLDCTVGHDTRIDDFATISPGVHISGRVHIGSGAFIGTGATIIEGITVGEGAVIGAGACVTKDIPAFKMAYGVPAKVIKDV